MTSNDKDFRFMAINDLMAELQKDSIKLDDESERRVKYFKILLSELSQDNSIDLRHCVTWLQSVDLKYFSCYVLFGIHIYFQLFQRLFTCF